MANIPHAVSASAISVSGYEHLGAAGNARGITAILVGSVLYVVGDTLLKLCGLELPIGEIVFARAVVAGAMLYLIARRRGVIPTLPRIFANPLVLLRTGCDSASTLCYMVGLVRMSYSDAAAIFQFAPLAVTAGAAVFLGDSVGWRRWMAAAAGFIGVLIILQPGAGTFDWNGLYILGSVVFFAARDLITRRLGPGVPTLGLALVSVTSTAMFGLLMMPFEGAWVKPTSEVSAYIVVAAVSFILSFFCTIVGSRSGEVAVVAPFRYAMIPFAVVSSILVFHDWPNSLTLVGLSIVIGAGLYSLHRERVRAQAAAALYS